MAGFVQAIGFDLDGTLTDGPVLFNEAMTAIEVTRERGIAAVLVTGRILDELRQEFADLPERFDPVVARTAPFCCTPTSSTTWPHPSTRS